MTCVFLPSPRDPNLLMGSSFRSALTPTRGRLFRNFIDYPTEESAPLHLQQWVGKFPGPAMACYFANPYHCLPGLPCQPLPLRHSRGGCRLHSSRHDGAGSGHEDEVEQVASPHSCLLPPCTTLLPPCYFFATTLLLICYRPATCLLPPCYLLATILSPLCYRFDATLLLACHHPATTLLHP